MDKVFWPPSMLELLDIYRTLPYDALLKHMRCILVVHLGPRTHPNVLSYDEITFKYSSSPLPFYISPPRICRANYQYRSSEPLQHPPPPPRLIVFLIRFVQSISCLISLSFLQLPSHGLVFCSNDAQLKEIFGSESEFNPRLEEKKHLR